MPSCHQLMLTNRLFANYSHSYHLLPATHECYSLHATACLLLTTCCSLLITHYLLQACRLFAFTK